MAEQEHNYLVHIHIGEGIKAICDITVDTGGDYAPPMGIYGYPLETGSAPMCKRMTQLQTRPSRFQISRGKAGVGLTESPSTCRTIQ